MAIDLYLTNACNLSCKFCFNLDEVAAPRLPLDHVKRILDAAYSVGHRFVNLTGGEPFIYKHLFEVIDYAHHLGFWVQVLTHGGLITPEHISRLTPYWRLRLRVSLDGGTRITHDELRGLGTFDTTCNKISMLADAGLTIGIGMTVSERNVSEIPEVVTCGLSRGVSFLRFSPVARVRKGTSASIDASLHKRIIASILDQTIKYIDLVDLPVVAEQGTTAQVAQLTTRRCMAGKKFASVTSAGDLLPCPLISEDPSVYAIRFHNADTFNQLGARMDGLFQDLRPALQGMCAECHFRSICYGGCLAEKVSFERGPSDEQPVCTKLILEDLAPKYEASVFERIIASWLARLRQSPEFDDIHACMRQAPYWNIDFRRSKNSHSFSPAFN
jgi:radical SAM protein with 4Fe4S-binding SPASM domain